MECIWFEYDVNKKYINSKLVTDYFQNKGYFDHIVG